MTIIVRNHDRRDRFIGVRISPSSTRKGRASKPIARATSKNSITSRQRSPGFLNSAPAFDIGPLTWLTNTALSRTRLYWENKGASFFTVNRRRGPTAVSVFPDEFYPAPRSWAEWVPPKLIHFNKVEKGGHFAACEPREANEACVNLVKSERRVYL